MNQDTPKVMVATRIPYVFAGTEDFDRDLLKKATKAQ